MGAQAKQAPIVSWLLDQIMAQPEIDDAALIELALACLDQAGVSAWRQAKIAALLGAI